MNATGSATSWTDANQACLVSEFARLARRLATESCSDEVDHTPFRLNPPSAMDRLEQIFNLSHFERQILLLAAGVEMDSTLADHCRQTHGPSPKAIVTFRLALASLANPHWSAVVPQGPLRRYRLIELEPGSSLVSAPLRIDERILHYLVGLNQPDPRLRPLIHRVDTPGSMADDHQAVARQALRILDGNDQPPPLLHLCGDDPNGQEDVAVLTALARGLTLYTVQTEDLPPPGPELDLFASLWERESLLLPAALLIHCGSTGLSPSARQIIQRTPGLIFLASDEPVKVSRVGFRLDVDRPSPADRRSLWKQALGASSDSVDATINDLAQQFRLSARTIHSTGSMAVSQEGAFARSELWKLCASFARPRLETLAQRMVPDVGWEDLVLPERQIQTLRHLVAQVRHRMTVYETWGFSARGRRGLGISALFSGDSGTGKTLAAEVMAASLALDLYRIDLSAVVSKFIGETEKNLKQVFDAAEEGGALLLFDEADALFGKRSEVKDSHDRYANIEVSYLLQRIESYQGLAILTTNLKSALDRSFQRRLRFSVHFPFPDVLQREALWKRAFFPETPTEGLDVGKLAQLNVTGGSIRNIALNAAFLAAEDGKPVSMTHLLQSARMEAQKLERSLSEAEIRGWV